MGSSGSFVDPLSGASLGSPRAIAVNCRGTHVAVLSDRPVGGSGGGGEPVLEPDSRLHVYDADRDMVVSYDCAGGLAGGGGAGRHPVSVFWDADEPKLLAMESRRARGAAAGQPPAPGGEEGKEGWSGSEDEDGDEEEAKTGGGEGKAGEAKESDRGYYRGGGGGDEGVAMSPTRAFNNSHEASEQLRRLHEGGPGGGGGGPGGGAGGGSDGEVATLFVDSEHGVQLQVGQGCGGGAGLWRGWGGDKLGGGSGHLGVAGPSPLLFEQASFVVHPCLSLDSSSDLAPLPLFPCPFPCPGHPPSRGAARGPGGSPGAAPLLRRQAVARRQGRAARPARALQRGALPHPKGGQAQITLTPTLPRPQG